MLSKQVNEADLPSSTCGLRYYQNPFHKLRFIAGQDAAGWYSVVGRLLVEDGDIGRGWQGMEAFLL